jgi:very-short-patch-repair endonuclease
MTIQGREADIVFISMVSDTETVRALSGEMYEQRFNVAVSRAKDRLYLYRSFRREDLRVDDLRARLLEHFAAPLHRDPEKKGRERCESDFERAVFDRLHTAGYRVIPQVSAGGYRIDLVVEGRSGRRLAIECDGDQYHTPDVWLEDLHRQRTLERAGWTFWRCWGSSFIRDPDECIADLLRTLERLGVEPVGPADVDFSEIVEYREVGAIAADAEPSVPPDETAADAAREQVPEPRQPAPDTRAAPRPMAQQRAVQSELLPPDGALPLWNNEKSTPRAQLGDSVRYCFIDSPDEQPFVTIVETESRHHLGLLNCEDATAKALLGLAAGEQRDAQVPSGCRTVRLLELHRPTRR